MGNTENCAVTDQGVQELLGLRQLRELRLGSAGEQPTSNKFTVKGFLAVMRAL